MLRLQDGRAGGLASTPRHRHAMTPRRGESGRSASQKHPGSCVADTCLTQHVGASLNGKRSWPRPQTVEGGLSRRLHAPTARHGAVTRPHHACLKDHNHRFFITGGKSFRWSFSNGCRLQRMSANERDVTSSACGTRSETVRCPLGLWDESSPSPNL